MILRARCSRSGNKSPVETIEEINEEATDEWQKKNPPNGFYVDAFRSMYSQRHVDVDVEQYEAWDAIEEYEL